MERRLLGGTQVIAEVNRQFGVTTNSAAQVIPCFYHHQFPLNCVKSHYTNRLADFQPKLYNATITFFLASNHSHHISGLIPA